MSSNTKQTFAVLADVFICVSDGSFSNPDSAVLLRLILNTDVESMRKSVLVA